MAVEQWGGPRDFETLPIIDKIISFKMIAPLINKILEHKTLGPIFKKMLDREIVTYLICGVLTTIVGFFSFWLSRQIGFSGALSNIVSSAVAILFAFIINKHFVFLSKDWSFKKTGRELWQFTGGRLIVMAGDTGLIFLLVDVLGLNDNICKLATLILVMITNYIISKMIF